MKIEILEVIKNENGTFSINFEYDDEYEEFLKKELNCDNPSEEQIQNYILSVIHQVVEKEEE